MMLKEVKTTELIEFAGEQQRRFDNSVSSVERKKQGHFGTPPVIAQFMADMFTKIPAKTVRILDPGAGVGTLSAAICQRLVLENQPRSVYFELWENDSRLVPILEGTMRRCQTYLRDVGIEMQFKVRVEDFILSNTQRTLFTNGSEPTFHLAILNPPYFKIRKESPQAQAMAHVVHGQPNVYVLFMAIAANLLLPKGELVAITPRSYFNGPYFKRFRNWFFDRMGAQHIHLFESRTAAFKDDSVLQENVILRAAKGMKPKDVLVTVSDGRDFINVERTITSYDKIIDDSTGDRVVRVTTSNLDREIVDTMDRLPKRFRDLGLEISTGPVVSFRSTEFLRHDQSNDTAPLLWMHNVRPFITRFPAKQGKPSHIEISKASKKLLVLAKTYVLLKRFTAKEEKRRLVAGIVTRADSYSEWLGLENHLNYVYRKNTDLDDAEAYGIAAYFNSSLVDRYFRAISGNTQVNAAEIRGMPIPQSDTLRQIGEQVRKIDTREGSAIEHVIGNAVCLPRHLLEELVKASQ